ncbi:hypothetical protein E2I00_011914 [Balaenoptera physalus]|uniref:RING-type domain-containing protein n=1 Tax=Balaenoptera physalus TaxID=9770 RepID=A0A6A1Q4M8_BALPH|nr:hypothetical protein E2I00_011914 [Balaenoptera physalus]
MGNCLKSSILDDSSVPESPSRWVGPGGTRRWDQEPHPEQVPNPIHLPTPSPLHQAAQLTEEEQVRLAQRISLKKHLPQGVYGTDGFEEKIQEECVICWLEFMCGDSIRSLPCEHFYHLNCINEWLTRSFTCPYCRGPVDVAQPSSQDIN